jgi:hypothetical protein
MKPTKTIRRLEMMNLYDPASNRQATFVRADGNVLDINGYELFSQGENGAVHALAHRMSDSGRCHLGHRLLGDWLASRNGEGSDWIHLQFHMAVFELALGDWNGAYGRFLTQVLPAASTTTCALTDAPALLWRLAISAPGSLALPWRPLRRTALARIEHDADPFIQIHHLLALAGAGDAACINVWLQHGERHPLVERFGLACADLARRCYAEAGRRLQGLLRELPQIGGSHAQGQLFGQLADWARKQRPLHKDVHRIAA